LPVDRRDDDAVSAADPFLWVLAGPNGAGKSTYYQRKIEPVLKLEFVNADLIARARWGSDAESHAYDAARMAREKHQELINGRRSFVAETVFSHPSKVDLIRSAKDHGYLVWLTFIYLESDELAVARVRERVDQGGHNVPDEKIRDRYGRLPEIVKEAIRWADKAFVVDNSYLDRALRDVLIFERGRLTYRAPDLPEWTRRIFQEALSL
jgi:predicted ABC-type ATPase